MVYMKLVYILHTEYSAHPFRFLLGHVIGFEGSLKACTLYTMRGSRKFCQRGSNLTFIF